MEEKLAINGGTPVRGTPFAGWPVHGEEEEKALLKVLNSGKWWRFAFGQGVDLAEPETGEQAETVEFQKEFAAHHNCKYGIAAANGTATLEMGLRALNFNIGDEVIVPAYAYIASATCVLQNNLVPVFADIDPDTYNLSPESAEAAITDRTRAIVVVHFGGQVADMDSFMRLAEKYNLTIIEDAAHAHGSEWNGQKAGSFGKFSSFSFQASKNMTAGEGGIICSNDHDFISECEALMWSGRKVGRPWYEFHRLGWNYRITEFQSAILRAQLGRLEQQNSRREQNAALLNAGLSKIPGIRPLARAPRATRHSYHVYMVRFDTETVGTSREKFVNALNAEGIPAATGYAYPLYNNPMFLEKNFISGSFPLGTEYHPDIDYSSFAQKCPVAEKACSSEAIWLPQNVLLGTEKDMLDIIEAFKKVSILVEQLRG